MEEQAKTLTRAVGSFKLAEDGRGAAPKASAPQAPAAQAAPVARPKPSVKQASVAELPHKRPTGKGKEEGWEEF